MFYHLLYPLHTSLSVFNVFRYITFRTIYAGLTAFLICFLLGPWVIKKLTELNCKQYIRDDGPKTHYSKAGTPTMGGILIVFSVLLSTLLWANLTVFYIWIVLLITVGFGLIGFFDDYMMLAKKRSRGLSVKKKFIAQAIVAAAAAIILCYNSDFSTYITIPFCKNLSIDLGKWYILLAFTVIISSSNAVNLTDGLDGLAIGPIIVAFSTYMLFAYVTGHFRIADYLQLNYVSGCGEITVFCGAMAGAGAGFLWFNAYPAQMFMGDTGSMSTGAALGAVAVITKQEILLILVGGLFVVETLSVIFQVGFFKITNGNRIFKMAPLHHHFELKGLPEPKITVRFWIIAIILALISFSTLKVR